MRPKTIIGIVLLAGFGFLVMKSFGEQIGGYTGFAEASALDGRAHVIGFLERDRPAVYDPETNVFSFWMKDQQGDVRRVDYAQPKPANFEEAEQVVIEGRMDGDVFAADRILIKCPSKYNDERGFQDADGNPAELPFAPTNVDASY